MGSKSVSFLYVVSWLDNSMFDSKRGMSPLIATILLIAFAVSIGAVIMSYGNLYDEVDDVDKVDLEVFCKDVDLEVYDIGGESQICKTTTGEKDLVTFILINKGSKDIDGLQMLVSLKGAVSSVQVLELSSSSVGSGSFIERQISIDNKGKTLVQLQFISIVSDGSETKKCFSTPITEIKDC